MRSCHAAGAWMQRSVSRIDAGVAREIGARVERQADAVELEEGDPLGFAHRALPSEGFVERAGAIEVADTQGSEAEALFQ